MKIKDVKNKIKTPLSLHRKHEFLYKLLKSEITKNPFTFSEVEESLGYKNPQPDLREIMKLLVDLKIFKFYKKERHGYNIYVFDEKKFLEWLYNSDLCEFFKDVIMRAKLVAMV